MVGRTRWLVVVLSLCSVGGCNWFPSDEQHADAALGAVRQRVEFDMNCSGSEATLVRLGDVNHIATQTTATTIGARCADLRATYVVTCVSTNGDLRCTAEMNTSGGEAPARPQRASQ